MASTIDQVNAQLVAIVAKERDALALEIVSETQKAPPVGTPVRTGWARANAIPSLGQPVASPARVPKGADVTGAQAQQTAAVATLVATGPQKPRVPAFVSLAYPYANRLNEGWSKQTAAGFWERAVDRAIVTRQAAGRVTITKL